MTMQLKTTMIPILLATAPFLGAWNHFVPTNVETAAVSTELVAPTTPLAVASPAQLGDDERAQLLQAQEQSQSLAAMRGGDLSNHELGIGLAVVAVILLIILI
jgi:hypothetical protein